ncbi:MAG: hypothetical protein UDG86_06075 [Lachnospiraceae bacterium]|nr:hypothetical protein [Lachnospiraceae bacterium]
MDEAILRHFLSLCISIGLGGGFMISTILIFITSVIFKAMSLLNKQ